MDLRRQLLRSTPIIGMLSALWATPAPIFADGAHATLNVIPVTPTLTLSDSGAIHVGLVRVEFATEPSDARHAVMTITTPEPVTVAGTLANGTRLVLPDDCTGTGMGSVVTTPVRCRVDHQENQDEDWNGNGNGSQDEDRDDNSAARIPIEFQSPSTCTGLSSSTPPCLLSFAASVSSSEGYQARKSNQSATGSVRLFASSTPQHPQPAVGDCVPLSNRLTTLSTLSTSLPQTAQTTFGPAASGTGDPCTSASVGAVNFPHGKPATFVLGQVWFVELDKLDPNVNNGLATATLQLTNFSSEGSHNIVLKEFKQSVFSPNFDPTQFTLVPNCVGSPLQPPAGADSCISSVTRGDGDSDDAHSPDADDNVLSFNLVIRPTGADPGFSG